MNNPKIGIAVSCYNHQRFVRKCLDSIFNQTYDNFFVTVFDNNSTDHSRWVVKDFQEDGRVTKEKKLILDMPLFTKGTLPIGVARWLMIQRIVNDCDWIAIVDADDTWNKYKLSSQVAEIKDKYNARLCFSDCYYLLWEDTYKQVPEYPIVYQAEKEIIGKKTFNEKYPVPPYNHFETLLTKRNFMPCPTLMFESNAFKELITNPSHYTSAEDYDWVLRFASKYPIAYADAPLAYYRIHKDQLTQRTPVFCTAEEIDVIRRACEWMNPKVYNRLKMKIRRHLIWLYMKMIYKEIS